MLVNFVSFCLYTSFEAPEILPLVKKKNIMAILGFFRKQKESPSPENTFFVA